MTSSKVARNDPCPCGSGLKYKRCCMNRESESRSAMQGLITEDVAREARRQREWEADIIALPVAVSTLRGGYPTVTLVCAGPMVVHVSEGAAPGAEPEQVAKALAGALEAAASAVGGWPDAVRVRHADAAHALNARFEGGLGALGRGDRPTVDYGGLSDLDAAARSLLEQLAGEPVWPPIATASKWADWGLPDAEVAALFGAAAAYYRAAPWEVLDDQPPLWADWPDDDWTLAVLGGAGETLGLAVYDDEDDYEATIEAPPPEEMLDDPTSWVLGLTFVRRNELPRPMQREVARSGWEVAAPDAYPFLFPMLTPAGGIPRSVARRLTAVLEAVAELAREERGRLDRGQPAEVEGADGLRVVYPGEDPDDRPPDVPPELEDVFDELRSGRFETFDEAEEYVARRVAAYNLTPRDDLSGLSPSQAQALLDGGFAEDSPLRLVDDLDPEALEGSDFLHNARTLLLAIDDGGTPATAAGNLRRAFVADMLDAMRWPTGWHEITRSVNTVINEADADLLHRVRVVVELAGLIQLRNGRFHVTKQGLRLRLEDAAGRLMAHLFRTYFSDFNIGYRGRGPDTGLIQQGVPVYLARLPREAGDWVDRDTLARRLVPPVADPEDDGQWHGVDVRAIQLAVHVLGPLARFGLLEERRPTPVYGPADVRVTPLFDRFVRVEWEER